MKINDKVFGGIMAALIGDAMGGPTEMRTRDQIIEFFGGYVKEFIDPPNDVFAKGRLPGQVTDDFSIAYYLLKEIVKDAGVITSELGKNAILNWADDTEYSSRFAGPTTMMAINKLRENLEFDPSKEFGLVNYNNLGTNGAAMKIFPVGLLNGRDFDKTVLDVITVCAHTHFTNAALSGACAIACAVGEALQDDSTINSITDAGVYGAKYGNLKALEITKKVCAGPSIERRIELAAKIGKSATSFDQLLIDINDIIGGGIWVWESVPAVFGIINGVTNTMDAIYAGVNIGNDTDTIATMAGAILGTHFGIDSIDKKCVEIGLSVNDMELKDLSAALSKLV